MRTTVIYSLLVWLGFAFIFGLLVLAFNDLDVTLIRITSLFIPMMAIFYLNLNWLAPHYLERNKKKQYFVYVGIIAVIYTTSTAYMDMYFDSVYPITMHDFTKRPMFFVFFGRFMSMIPPFVISALINRSMLLQKKTKESLELQNKMLEAETKALKAQINPHFLFNSLNNIYSLSQMKSDKTPEAILQLSEILRYVTYDGDQQVVELGKEINVIQNFIQLQHLKEDNLDNVEINIEIENPNLKIAPLLLIPFIENAFKHSNFEDKSKGWIKIKIQTHDRELILISENSIGNFGEKRDAVGGVGMDNVKKRLSLLYPDDHKLGIKYDDRSYQVELKIKLEL